MTKPLDLFASIQLDAQAKRPSQPALPGSSDAPTSSEMVVSQAMAAKPVSLALDQALAKAPLTSDKAGILKAQATALVGSEPFLREASKEIGVPQPGESEDEFVDRAKATLRALLSKSLKG